MASEVGIWSEVRQYYGEYVKGNGSIPTPSW